MNRALNGQTYKITKPVWEKSPLCGFAHYSKVRSVFPEHIAKLLSTNGYVEFGDYGSPEDAQALNASFDELKSLVVPLADIGIVLGDRINIRKSLPDGRETIGWRATLRVKEGENHDPNTGRLGNRRG